MARTVLRDDAGTALASGGPTRLAGSPRSAAGPPTPIFVPTAQTVATAQLTDFIRSWSGFAEVPASSYWDFEDFCRVNYPAFWRRFVEWADLIVEGALDPVCEGADPETAEFFPNVRLNYVENLLRIDSPEDERRPALRVAGAGGASAVVTRRQLLDRVVAAADALQALGVTVGDRVVAVVRNDVAAVVAALAALRLGATFSSAAPDMGPQSILARFSQLQPTVLFAHAEGDVLSSGTSIQDRLSAVIDGLPSLRAVVCLDEGSAPGSARPDVYRLRDLCDVRRCPDSPVTWDRFPFDHPLFIMFSSGTTGRPKAIVHGAGGTLIEHVKEHRLHTDLQAGDTLFFQTSAAWMMWNWQLSALASQVAIVLPSTGLVTPELLWSVVEREGVTVLGTNPAYLQLCERSGIDLRSRFNLTGLRAVLATGSILHDRQYEWLVRQVGSLPVMSISGGTDIIGCFLLGNPTLPVYAGELQCRSLGLDVAAVARAGGRPGDPIGELVCRNPFPSRPVGFEGVDARTRFHDAYFAANPGLWTHGDLVEFTDHGGARIHGRSDGVLNVAGVRIGPAEIYAIVQEVSEVRDAMAVEQPRPDDPAVGRLVLLLVMERPGALTAELQRRIRRLLSERGSAWHVPDLIVEVEELPVTYSGKRSDHAVRQALTGRPIDNSEALRNPASLDVIRWQVRLEDGRSAADRSWSVAEEVADPREALVMAAFREALGVDVSRTDDFFQLGGTSLQVMRAFERIRHATGVPLPLSTMYRCATPAALALALADDQPADVSPLVLLRDGAELPIFLIHDITGDLFYQRHFVAALTTRRRLYGLRVPGVAGSGKSPASVEGFAAIYVEHIRTVQPVGPYSLLGYSFGGLVALEMARRLHAAGDEVNFLGIVDSYVESPKLGKRLARRLRRRIGLALPVVRSPRSEMPSLLRRRLVDAAPWLNVSLTDEDRLRWPPAMAPCEVANRTYRPKPFPGAAAIYYAMQRRPGFRQTDLDWADVVSGTLCRRAVPGDHFSAVQPPHAAELARRVCDDLAAMGKPIENPSSRTNVSIAR